MVIDRGLVGKFVTLQSADEDDSAFIIRLRNDEKISRFLPKIPEDLHGQKKWIREQRTRDDDYYFVILDNVNQERIGTLSIYEIRGDEAETGRAASYGTAMQNTEAMLLLYDFAFTVLRLKQTRVEIIRGNDNAIEFNRKLGYQPFPEGDTQRMLCYTLQRDAYMKHTQRIRRFYRED
ncbi:MAG: GNAT family N-acetyltransferase, partial [Firmicutes bacterium]|nr:GNAT family N-acetyltransferase [Bacillota bacterium]